MTGCFLQAFAHTVFNVSAVLSNFTNKLFPMLVVLTSLTSKIVRSINLSLTLSKPFIVRHIFSFPCLLKHPNSDQCVLIASSCVPRTFPNDEKTCPKSSDAVYLPGVRVLCHDTVPDSISLMNLINDSLSDLAFIDA